MTPARARWYRFTMPPRYRYVYAGTSLPRQPSRRRTRGVGASSPSARTLAKKSTGNYNVRLQEEDGIHFMSVEWTGEWGSGAEVDVELGRDGREVSDYIAKWARTDDDAEANRLAVKWFNNFIRGDLDVRRWLQQSRYDEATNYRGGR